MAFILWFAPNSVQTLEIIDPLHTELWGTSNKKKSLFQMLKTTKTTGGYALQHILKSYVSFFIHIMMLYVELLSSCGYSLQYGCPRSRLLRANLLQPLKDIQTINTRLDCLVSMFCIYIIIYLWVSPNWSVTGHMVYLTFWLSEVCYTFYVHYVNVKLIMI